ncbi:multicopper oxidase-domain-containing protein [Pilobolus umbonatus]|nr:multicopper oxidase-domain-containing protein [Pilobolus umbonatus]
MIGHYLFVFSLLLHLIQARYHQYEFNVSSGIVNPDCSSTGALVPLINGQFPGPSIHIEQNDEIEILVRNTMTDRNTSIHYHGIRQIGSPESDGVPGVTQSPIAPGSTYLYRFKVTQQAGTYFYHAHIGLQDDSILGSFIVYESQDANPFDYNENPHRKESLQAGPYTYKDDLVLQLSEWWHDDLTSRENYYTGTAFVFDHGADSILMNGRTVHDPNSTLISPDNCKGYTTLNVEPNSTYRLRVIGSNTFRTLSIGIKDHNMTIIEVDGELVHPYDVSYLEVTPGQRFSVLLNTGDYDDNTIFGIGTAYSWRQRGAGITENGFGLLRYSDRPRQEEDHLFKTIHKRVDARNQTATITEPRRKPKVVQIYDDLPVFPQQDVLNWVWPYIKPLNPRDPILDETDVRILKLDSTATRLNDSTFRYLINNRPPQVRHQTALYDISNYAHNNTEPDGYNPIMDTYNVHYNETLDLVFQNMRNSDGFCLLHPWHTHGHSHYIIASGYDEYVHSRDGDIRNYPHPVYKDVSTVYPAIQDPTNKNCGWTKVRMKANNPGFWAVHCHITTHMIQGKMIVLEEASHLISKSSLFNRERKHIHNGVLSNYLG